MISKLKLKHFLRKHDASNDIINLFLLLDNKKAKEMMYILKKIEERGESVNQFTEEVKSILTRK